MIILKYWYNYLNGCKRLLSCTMLKHQHWFGCEWNKILGLHVFTWSLLKSLLLGSFWRQGALVVLSRNVFLNGETGQPSPDSKGEEGTGTVRSGPITREVSCWSRPLTQTNTHRHTRAHTHWQSLCTLSGSHELKPENIPFGLFDRVLMSSWGWRRCNNLLWRRESPDKLVD